MSSFGSAPFQLTIFSSSLQPRDDSEITPMCLVIVLVILSFILISSFIFNFSDRRKANLYTGSKGNIALSSAASSIGSKFFL